MEEFHMTDSNSLDDDERVTEWESGLPNQDDLPPLSHTLISPELASAFSIKPEPLRTMLDVNRASHNTFTSLQRSSNHSALIMNNLRSIGSFLDDPGGGGGEHVEEVRNDGSEVRKVRRIENSEEVYSSMKENSNNDEQSLKSNSKRTRLVWTPQLHKRFVDAVAHLGIKNAVPKTIMQLMNVEGLTRENVASHLQKYRLYLKRMQGLSNEGPSASDQLFESTPVPQSFHEGVGSGSGTTPMTYVQPPPPPPPPPPMLPVLGMGNVHGGMPPGMFPYHGFDPNQYNMFREREWNGNKFGSIVSHSRSE